MAAHVGPPPRGIRAGRPATWPPCGSSPSGPGRPPPQADTSANALSHSFMKEDFVSNPIRFLSSSLKPVALAAAVAATGLAAAPASAEFQQGDFELRLSGFAENDVNFDGVRANVNGALGYFISDQFEAGVRQSFSYTDIGTNDLAGQTNLFINYHFGTPDSSLQPFIGASVGYQYGDGVQDLFLGGPEGGIKWFFSEDWFVFGEVAYLFYFEDVDDADESFDDGEFNYALGIGVILPRGD